jgi:hypothetical protein
VYSTITAAAVLVAVALLFVEIAVVTPDDGLQHFPTLIAAYAFPVPLLAVVLWLVRDKLSLSARVAGAIGGAAALSAPAIFFLLVAVCFVRSNCL